MNLNKDSYAFVLCVLLMSGCVAPTQSVVRNEGSIQSEVVDTVSTNTFGFGVGPAVTGNPLGLTCLIMQILPVDRPTARDYDTMIHRTLLAFDKDIATLAMFGSQYHGAERARLEQLFEMYFVPNAYVVVSSTCHSQQTMSAKEYTRRVTSYGNADISIDVDETSFRPVRYVYGDVVEVDVRQVFRNANGSYRDTTVKKITLQLESKKEYGKTYLFVRIRSIEVLSCVQWSGFE